jgi:NADH-quinone oxidoreductase subunit J
MLDTIIAHSDQVAFYFFAATALLSALVVVGQRHPTYSAFALIVTLCSLSAVFGLLGSPFIAVLQVVVYAGAIMVLFLFVLMLLNVKREERVPGGGWAPGFNASTPYVARLLFSPTYLYVFEATSILILAALVGAVVLAKSDP